MYSKPVSPHDLAKQDPGPTDVICARGKRALEHIGNKRYKGLITKHLQVYSDAKTKLEKSLIVNHIIDAVRNASPQGNFIREENGVWVEVGDAVAREKIGQRYASRFLFVDGGSSVDEHHMLTLLVFPCSLPFIYSFRDSLHTQYKSSTKAKKQRKKNQIKAIKQKVQSGPEPMIATSECTSSDSSNSSSQAFRKLSQRLSGVEILNFSVDDFPEEIGSGDDDLLQKRDSLVSFRRSSLLELMMQPKRASLVDLSNEKDHLASQKQRRNSSRRLSEAVMDFAAGLEAIHDVDDEGALFSNRSSLSAVMIDSTRDSSSPIPLEPVSSMNVPEQMMDESSSNASAAGDDRENEGDNDDVFAMPKPKGTFAFSMTSKPKFGNLLCMDQLPSFCKPDHVLLRQQVSQ